MLDRFSKREKLFLLAGFLIVGLTLYYLLLFSPLREETANSRQQLENLEREYEDYLSQIEDIPRLEEELEELEEEVGIADEAEGPDRKENVLDFLDEGLARHDLNLRSYSPESAEDGDFVHLQLAGSYHGLLDFIGRSYEHYPRLKAEEMYINMEENVLEIEILLFLED
ncbi:type II secretion system protein GspM [Halarsenatibacter silvermanii]|uniref:Type II secretion system (T2SS), protein M n=1 Tax=Halarsenatibacter silvermanii TaxID=321763 RepID=A0A1G9LAN2_9FIRM|nr:type II secretion system protein GspM [Halarsenatibacter silvermanii]SDL59031.1 Type II secretion system (T2SS), protein M [Halarsenatibacter silvermanii]